MYYTLDRTEDNETAVLTDDNGKVYNEKLSLLHENSRIGDVFILQNGRFILDEAETDARKQRISEKRNKFFDRLKKNKEE